MSIAVLLGMIALQFVAYAIGSGTNTIAAIFAGIFFINGAALYFYPAIIAARREHKNKTSIVLVNLFLGWTLLGWVVALAWAYQGNATEPSHGIQPSILSAHAATSSVGDELTKLVALRDSGALTDAEFEAQKQKLLA